MWLRTNPGSFGYDEATRKFNLPPPSGQPELTFFASRATINIGLTNLSSSMITTNGVRLTISERDVEESPTVNQDIGGRLTLPLPTAGSLQSSISGGLDFKTYYVGSYKTNLFFFTQTNFDSTGLPILPPTYSVDPSQCPTTINHIEYLPLTLHYDATWRDFSGTAIFGLGVTFNPWFSSQTTTPIPLTPPTMILSPPIRLSRSTITKELIPSRTSPAPRNLPVIG